MSHGMTKVYYLLIYYLQAIVMKTKRSKYMKSLERRSVPQDRIRERGAAVSSIRKLNGLSQ